MMMLDEHESSPRRRERLGERENIAVYLDLANCASSGPPALPNCAKDSRRHAKFNSQQYATKGTINERADRSTRLGSQLAFGFGGVPPNHSFGCEPKPGRRAQLRPGLLLKMFFGPTRGR
jgi:hypothetical protein